MIGQVSKEQLQPKLRQGMNEVKTQILKPYEKGKLLETDILKLLKAFFLIDDDTGDYILKTLRKQQGGMQNGFDIDFTYRNHAGESVRCVMECKNKKRQSLRRISSINLKIADNGHTRLNIGF